MNSIILSGMAWASSLRDAITTRIREERGQDLLEYAILAGAIGVIAFGAFAFFPMTDVVDGFALKVCQSIDIGDIGCTTAP